MSLSTFSRTSLKGAAAAAVDDIEPPKPEPFAPGIYFGLNEDLFHADPALGSTDIRKLAKSPENFWFASRFNPDPEDEEEITEAKIVGKAMHTMVLQGREKFERLYAPAWRAGNIKAGKDERAEILARGKLPIKGRYWRRILVAGAILRGNPHLSDAFNNVIGAEVSIFWVEPESGMPKKARFDVLKQRSVVDIKSIVNRDEIEFKTLCRRHIASYRYDVQAAHYLDGWRKMASLIDAGRVYGLADSEASAVLERLERAAKRDAAAFVFLFIQKSGAPLSWGATISPGNGVLDIARKEIEAATRNWRNYTERFGLNTPWVVEEPLEELDVDDLPAWYGR